MTQNILTTIDGWFDALPGDGDGLAKPGIGVVDAPTKAAANKPVSHPPAVAVTAPDTMTFHDSAQSPQGQVRTEVRTEKMVSTVAVTKPVTTVSAVSSAQVANEVATESRVGQRQPAGRNAQVAGSVATELAPASWRPAKSLPGGWRPTADAYYAHHWTCRQCIAAGMNHELTRCSIGAPLWMAYQREVATMKRNAS